jgi:hypothetical protein
MGLFQNGHRTEILLKKKKKISYLNQMGTRGSFPGGKAAGA